MEQLEFYYKRFRTRLWKDAAPWTRDNIILACGGFVVPPLALYLRDPHARIDWPLIQIALELYGLVFAIYFVFQFCRTSKKLDVERDGREKELNTLVADKEQVLAQRDKSIRTLTEKPPRARADQHNYEKIKKTLGIYKEVGVTAMRHLRNVGTVTIGGVSAANLPNGIPFDRAIWVYNGFAAEGLLIHKYAIGQTEQVYTVPDNLGKIFDEVLYED